MKIWLINPYGPIPGEGWRDYRFNIIAEELVKSRHKVIWWTATFAHHFKKQRANELKDLIINENYTIRLVPTCSYKKNISFNRFLKDLQFAYRTYQLGIRDTDKPDMIIYYESTLNFGYASIKLAEKLNVPIVLDQMDLWPELMINQFKYGKGFIKFLFSPILANRKKNLGKLDGIIALSDYYLNFCLAEFKALNNKPHAIIYNGIDITKFRRLSDSEFKIPEKRQHEIWAVFAGTLGPTYDLLNLLKIANENAILNLKILIAGDGPLKTEIISAANANENIIYFGKLAPNELAHLYMACDIGLCTYTSTSNVEMPDKFYDYSAAGLPILNSLIGEVSKWIEREKLGLNYIGSSLIDLTEKLKYLVENTEERKAMARNSYNIADFFDKNNQICQLTTIINSIK